MFRPVGMEVLDYSQCGDLITFKFEIISIQVVYVHVSNLTIYKGKFGHEFDGDISIGWDYFIICAKFERSMW